MADPIKVRGDALEWREVEGEVVALDLRKSLYLAINPSGAWLWPALVAGAAREDLLTTLIERGGVSREVANRDLEQFLAELADHDLLETGP